MKNVLAASGRRSLGTWQNLHSGSWLAVDAVLPASNVAQPQQVTIVLRKNSSNVIVNHSLRMYGFNNVCPSATKAAIISRFWRKASGFCGGLWGEGLDP